jgi:hypothetical protein
MRQGGGTERSSQAASAQRRAQDSEASYSELQLWQSTHPKDRTGLIKTGADNSFCLPLKGRRE